MSGRKGGGNGKGHDISIDIQSIVCGLHFIKGFISLLQKQQHKYGICNYIIGNDVFNVTINSPNQLLRQCLNCSAIKTSLRRTVPRVQDSAVQCSISFDSIMQ